MLGHQTFQKFSQKHPSGVHHIHKEAFAFWILTDIWIKKKFRNGEYLTCPDRVGL